MPKLDSTTLYAAPSIAYMFNKHLQNISFCVKCGYIVVIQKLYFSMYKAHVFHINHDAI